MGAVSMLLLLASCMIVLTQAQTYSYQQPPRLEGNVVCEGADARFTCRIVFTNPMNQQSNRTNTWQFSNETAITDTTPGHSLTIDPGTGDVTDLTVHSVRSEDDGTQYRCTTSGAPEDFVQSAVLDVAGVQVISNATASLMTTDITLTWTIVDVGSVCGPVTYTVQLLDGDRMVLQTLYTMDTTQTFTNLKCSTPYIITVFGTNRIGNGSTTERSVSTMDLPSLQTPIINDLNTTSESTSLNVSWTVTRGTECNDIVYTVRLELLTGETVASDTTMELTYQFTGLSSSTDYMVTVSGVNSAGMSNSFSKEATTTSGSNKSNPGLIIGIVIGCLVAVAIIIVIIVVVIYLLRPKDRKVSSEGNYKDVDAQPKSPTNTDGQQSEELVYHYARTGPVSVTFDNKPK